MKKYLLLLATGIILFRLGGFAWAQCPEDPIDLGVCDTFIAVSWDEGECDSFPCLVHVPLLVTHDSNTFWWEGGQRWVQDSISTFTIPLKWTHTNPTAYCSLSPDKNTTSFIPAANSIFRHFGGMHNRLLDLYEMGQEWTITQYIEPLHYFGLSLTPVGVRRWWEGDRVLLATLTFTVSDTMTICLDTMIVSGVWIELIFTRYDAMNYRPRHNMPLCMSIQLQPFKRGDANGDGVIDIADVLYLINYLFVNGPPPPAVRAGDANCDGQITIADVVYLINYLFADGPEPSCYY